MNRSIENKHFKDHINLKQAKTIKSICPDNSEPKDIITIYEFKNYIYNLCNTDDQQKISISIDTFESGNLIQYNDRTTKKVIFILPANNTQYISQINEFIEQNEGRGIEKDYYLVLYPKRSIEYHYILTKEKLIGYFENKIFDFFITLMPVSEGVFSLEYKDATRELLVSNEYFCHNLVAESILRLQIVYGKIPCFLVKGDSALQVMKIMEKMSIEYSKTQKLEEGSNEIDGMIVQDRKVDMLTPLLKQVTYAGLFDENLGQDYKSAYIPKTMTSIHDTKTNPSKEKFYHQRLDDTIFEQVKDLSFNDSGSFLSKRMTNYNDITKKGMQDVEQMQKLIELELEIKHVTLHTEICYELTSEFQKPINMESLQLEVQCLAGQNANPSTIYAFLEKLINRQENLNKIYKLLCIQSIVEGGIKSNIYDRFMHEIVTSYGLGQIKTFNLLEKNQLLLNRDKNDLVDSSNSLKILRKKKENQNFSWGHLRDPYKLIDPDWDVPKNKFKSIRYPYCGYLPLSVRIIESAIKDGWKTKDTIVHKILGEISTIGKLNSILRSDRKRVIAVYMIGGFTYSEIAAQKIQESTSNIELMICTTNIISYKDIIDPLIQENY